MIVWTLGCPRTLMVGVSLIVLSVACGSGTERSGAGGATATGGTTLTDGGSAGGSAGSGGGAGTGADAGTGGGRGIGGAGGAFAAVTAVFTSHCTRCHDPAQNYLPHYGDLSLAASDAYAALVNQPASERCGGTRVVPSDPSGSYLIRKLTDAAPCEGSQMPLPGELATFHPLSATELATITDWISAGAPP